MKTITFDKIENYISENAINKNSLWLIGERKWTIDKNKVILEKERDNKLPLKNGESGIFLITEIDWAKFNVDFAGCTRLVFFNAQEQFQFIAEDNSCKNYMLYKSTINGNTLELENIKNTGNGNFQFGFARRLGAIPNIDKKIQVIVDEENGEWRLCYV